MRLSKILNQVLLNFYQRVPYQVQALLFKIKAREKSQSRLEGEFEHFLKSYIDLWHADYEVVKEFQKGELESLLIKALENSTWYSSKYEEQSITKENIREDPLRVLKSLPILEKADIRADLEAISLQNVTDDEPIATYTSGTTGSPMKSYTNAESEQRLHAIKKRFHYTAGVPVNGTGIRFSGNQIISLSRKKPPFWHHNPYEDVWFFSLYHLRKQTLPVFIEKLKEFKPEKIMAEWIKILQ